MVLVAAALAWAVERRVTGPAVVHCRHPCRIVACLLGDPPRHYGQGVPVASFTAEAQRHAPRE